MYMLAWPGLQTALATCKIHQYTLHVVSSVCRAFIDQPCAAGANFSVAATLQQALHGRLSPAPGLFDRALQEIALVPPALRFVADSIVYTDGSKKGTSMSAAWIHPSSGNSAGSSCGSSSSSRSSSIRSSKLAILAALNVHRSEQSSLL